MTKKRNDVSENGSKTPEVKAAPIKGLMWGPGVTLKKGETTSRNTTLCYVCINKKIDLSFGKIDKWIWSIQSFNNDEKAIWEKFFDLFYNKNQ